VQGLNARQVASVQRRIAFTSVALANGQPVVIGGDGSRDEVIAKYVRDSCGSRHSGRRCTNCAASISCAGVRPSAATPMCSSNSQTAEIRQPIKLRAGAVRCGTLACGCC